MNFFILDQDPICAAIWQCNKHIVKMPLETAQMLCTVVRQRYGKVGTVKTKKGNEVVEHQRYLLHDLGEYDGMLNTEKANLYWSVHGKHPCTLWAGKSFENFSWAYHHGLALCFEYFHRYQKVHAAQKIIDDAYDYVKCKTDIKEWKTGQTIFPQAMPEEYKCDDPVTAYRKYYLGEKKRFAKWTKRTPPNWWLEKI